MKYLFTLLVAGIICGCGNTAFTSDSDSKSTEKKESNNGDVTPKGSSDVDTDNQPDDDDDDGGGNGTPAPNDPCVRNPGPGGLEFKYDGQKLEIYGTTNADLIGFTEPPSKRAGAFLLTTTDGEEEVFCPGSIHLYDLDSADTVDVVFWPLKPQIFQYGPDGNVDISF